MCWNPARSGLFEVKSYYKILSSSPFAVLPWKSIWKARVLPRAAFFVWTASHGKILTMDNLQKRCNCIVEWCCMCKASGESPKHLLLHCGVAQSLWSLVFCLFGVVWVMPEQVVDFMANWMGLFVTLSIRLSGVRSPYVSCGFFGERGINVCLRGLSEWWLSLSCFCFALCLIGCIILKVIVYPLLRNS